MVGDLAVVHIPGPGKTFVASHGGDPVQIRHRRRVLHKPVEILVDLPGHRGRQHPGVRPGVGGQLALIQLLDDLKGLVRTDLKPSGALVLQLRQVKKKRRVLLLLLLLHREHLAGERLWLLKPPDQLSGLLLLPESILLIEVPGTLPPGALHGPPLTFEAAARLPDGSHHPVEGRLHEFPDLPLPAHHHAQHASHHPSHRDHRIPGMKIVGNAVPVL